jgi:hypothetical protein
LRIVEVSVPLIYLEEERSFGGSLDDGGKRLAYYHQVLDRAIAATKTRRAPARPRAAVEKVCVAAERRTAPVDDYCPFFPC